MSNDVDLNRLRDLVVQNQVDDNTRPDAERDKVYVDQEGKIKLGETSEDKSDASEVPQETFASN